jgi:MraZ protein
LRLLYGEYDLSIDEKNRLLIPSEVRKAIEPEIDGSAFYLVVGTNEKLWLYLEKVYEELANQRRSSLAPKQNRVVFDQINFALAFKLEWDKTGRVLVPDKAIRRSGISRDVTLVGVRDHLELWNRSDWENWLKHLEEVRRSWTAEDGEATGKPAGDDETSLS